MEDKELEKLWQQIDIRITTLNDRTKALVIKARQLDNRIKILEGKNEK